jgi:hypothetical protein
MKPMKENGESESLEMAAMAWKEGGNEKCKISKK